MNSRQKGKRGELELAKILRENGYEARRGVQYKGGSDSPDVVGLPGMHIECKRVERLDLTAAYEQSFGEAGDGEIPLVVHKKNGEPWFVTLTLEDFIRMYKRSGYGKDHESCP